MTKPIVTKFMPYALALTLVSAAAATLTVATAGDMAEPTKDQARHPDIAAISDEHGLRTDVEFLPMPDKARDVIIALPDGKYLVQRYYPSGYSVVLKPQFEDAVATERDNEGELDSELAQLDEQLMR